MSELKPESENTEERLSDTEEAISQKADAETNSDAEPAKNADIDEESPAASEDEDFFYDDNGAYEARRAARKERRNKMRRRKRRMRIAGGIVVATAAAIGIGVGFYGEELQNFFMEQQTKITQMAKSAGTKKEAEPVQTSAEVEPEAENTVTPEAEDNPDGLSREDRALYRNAKHY